MELSRVWEGCGVSPRGRGSSFGSERAVGGGTNSHDAGSVVRLGLSRAQGASVLDREGRVMVSGILTLFVIAGGWTQ